ncbi:hypothetical protein [Cryobacterium frigoriphilum]|uniref:hypothetical protein n=1 Tax=Cryobacterium frigoriphilum TaxID=1259150 RepID=UPI00141B1AF1|nr:hypothetical protein [Cryobacterium frigoriphilum]
MSGCSSPPAGQHRRSGLDAVGGGQLVSDGGHDPTETIQALAYLTADLPPQGRSDTV